MRNAKLNIYNFFFILWTGFEHSNAPGSEVKTIYWIKTVEGTEYRFKRYRDLRVDNNCALAMEIIPPKKNGYRPFGILLSEIESTNLPLNRKKSDDARNNPTYMHQAQIMDAVKKVLASKADSESKIQTLWRLLI